MLPQKILEFLSFLARSGATLAGHTVALNWSTSSFNHAFATNLRARSVRSL